MIGHEIQVRIHRLVLDARVDHSASPSDLASLSAAISARLGGNAALAPIPTPRWQDAVVDAVTRRLDAAAVPVPVQRGKAGMSPSTFAKLAGGAR